MKDDQRYQAAKKRVDDIKGFYIHIGLFAVVNLMLFGLNMATNPDHLWFYWPLFGWGIALAVHTFVFVTEDKLLGPDWEDRKLRELLDHDQEPDSFSGTSVL